MAFRPLNCSIGRGCAVFLAFLLSGIVATASAQSSSINPTGGTLGSFVFTGPGQTLSTNLGDTFTSLSSSATTNFSFVDSYAFSTTDATANSDVISLKLSNLTSLSNLSIAVFSTSSISGSNIYTTLPTSTGTVVPGAGWSQDFTTVAGPNTIVSLSNVSLGTGNYFLQVRGTGTLAPASQASYGGTISLTSLPEPQAAFLTLAGVAGLAVLALARGRSRQPLAQ